jgi:hypothetical protein
MTKDLESVAEAVILKHREEPNYGFWRWNKDFFKDDYTRILIRRNLKEMGLIDEVLPNNPDQGTHLTNAGQEFVSMDEYNTLQKMREQKEKDDAALARLTVSDYRKTKHQAIAALMISIFVALLELLQMIIRH